MTTVRVRLLGPVGLEVDGAAARLGSRLRLVMVVLALSRGQPVAPSRLAELVWGEPPPAAAAATLRSHVAHLRRLVEPARPPGHPPRVIVTEHHGYALRLPDAQIDAARFEGLLASGRSALRSGDPASAATLLTDALTLWRGAALADVAELSFAVADAARLDALRTTARRLLAEAALALGRHEEVLEELHELVAARPTDEALRRHLAIALYRSDQLDTAAETCSEGLRLAHQRGLDAPTLQAIQTDILRRSPSLVWTPPAVPGAPVRPPAAVPVPPSPVLPSVLPLPVARPPSQLPPDVAEFTGRAAELAAIVDRLTGWQHHGTSAVAAVDGKPGVGKSALAVHLGHRLACRFPDGVLYVNLRGAEPHQVAPVDVLGRFLAALGVPGQQVPAELDAASAAYRSAMTARRVLVVLDNAADAAQVRPLLPASPGCAALVTSRRALVDLDVAVAVSLDLLPIDEAVVLLGRLAGPHRTAAEPAQARAVVRYCGLLPLAVRIAGARLRARPNWSVAVFAARLADQQRRLSELAVGDLAVRSSFQLGYQALDATDRRLFRLLGLLDNADFGVELAAAVAGLPVRHAEAALERLVDAQLAETHPPGRYRFHDLLRLFASECAEADETPQARAEAVAAGLSWYLDTVLGATEWLKPVPQRSSQLLDLRWGDDHGALAWLDSERVNLVSAARQAAAASPAAVGRVAWGLDEALLRYFNIRKSWSEWSGVCLAALDSADRAGELRAQAVAHRHLGVIHTQQRRFTDALDHMRHSLARFMELGDDSATAKVWGDLGILHAELRQFTESQDCFDSALTVSRVVGNRAMEGVLLNNLGLVHCQQGRYERAIECVQQALAIEAEISEATRCGTLESLASIYFRQGHYRDAVRWYRRSLELSRQYGDRWNEAHALRGLGLAERELHGRPAAGPYLRRALAIFSDLNAPEAGDVERLLDEPRPAGATDRPTSGRR